MTTRWWRAVVAGAVAVVGLAGCDSDGGAETRTVLVDFKHDEFASSFIGFFPDRVVVRPGDRVSFEQTWTGEPHSVTFGAAFNDSLGRLMDKLARGETLPASTDEADLAAVAALPPITGRPGEPFAVNQNAAQPCYLDAGMPPPDRDTPCPRRDKPEFDGRHAYYSSGFIPYEGAGGGRYDITLADDIAPGRYNFVCTLHGVGQATAIIVAREGRQIASQSQVARAARRQIDSRYADSLIRARRAADAGTVTYAGKTYKAPLAGVASDAVRAWTGEPHRRHLHRHGSVNEFVPAELTARTGEKVTWTFIGRHTVSFNVPTYFPIFTVAGDGTVAIAPDAYKPVGWPGRAPDAPRDAPATVDAGNWDGRGFRSSGLDWENGDTFSVTFTQSGTYKFACLVHPPMVGEIRVS